MRQDGAFNASSPPPARSDRMSQQTTNRLQEPSPALAFVISQGLPVSPRIPSPASSVAKTFGQPLLTPSARH